MKRKIEFILVTGYKRIVEVDDTLTVLEIKQFLKNTCFIHFHVESMRFISNGIQLDNESFIPHSINSIALAIKS